MAARKTPAKAPAKSRKPSAPAKKAAPNQARGGGKAPRRTHYPKEAGSIPAPATKPKAGVAQSVEQRPRKSKVAGSKPAAGSTKPIDVTAALTTPGAPDPAAPFSPPVRAFIEEYLKSLNGTAAYRLVHPDSAVNTAATEAWRILRKPEVRAFIEAERKKLTEVYGMSKEDLVADLVAIVRADPSELMQVRHVACELCWGGDGKGGAWVEPEPDCETCGGIGKLRTWFADTRHLAPSVRALFAGVKVTKEGLQLLLESKDSAREKLAKILGAYELDNSQKVDALASLLGGIGRSALPVVKDPEA